MAGAAENPSAAACGLRRRQSSWIVSFSCSWKNGQEWSLGTGDLSPLPEEWPWLPHTACVWSTAALGQSLEADPCQGPSTSELAQLRATVPGSDQPHVARCQGYASSRRLLLPCLFVSFPRHRAESPPGSMTWGLSLIHI